MAAAPVAAEPAAPVIPPRSDAAHLSNPAPVYPAVSRRLREQGRVLFDVYILPDGTVGEIKLKRSSSFARLDEAAQEAGYCPEPDQNQYCDVETRHGFKSMTRPSPGQRDSGAMTDHHGTRHPQPLRHRRALGAGRPRHQDRGHRAAAGGRHRPR